MLSIEDFYKEIGKNIFIYPLKNVRILGNSIDLTASRFAWTSTGKYIFNDQTKEIIVPPHETACVLTQEAIYVTEKIGGTYHSRVTLAQRGFGHIGTMLDPKYVGQSLILLHNTTNRELKISYGERIVSIVFHYLNTPILTKSHNASPAHVEKITGFERFDEYKRWYEKNRWAFEERELVDHFLTSQEYEDLQKKEATDQETWNNTPQKVKCFVKRKGKKYVILICVCIVLYLSTSLIFSRMQLSDRIDLISVLIAAIIGCLSSDLTQGDDKKQ